MVKQSILKILGSKETSPNAVVTGSSKTNGGNLNNVRCEVSRHVRKIKREYLKGKINGTATTCTNKNIRDLNRGIN
jgi:hypothetical protein